MRRRFSVGMTPVAGLLVCAAYRCLGNPERKMESGPTYAGDLGATRYSPLDQINASNFNKLEVAWRFKTD